jgi:hypothetical protein
MAGTTIHNKAILRLLIAVIITLSNTPAENMRCLKPDFGNSGFSFTNIPHTKFVNRD